ncbi:hypothetical protein MAR_037698, partial [Mya arenaria]
RQPVKPEISKPQVAQVKPERSKPQVAQVKPERSKPQVAQVKPERSKPQVAKVKPERSKPQVAQVKPEISKPPTTRVKPVTNVRETRRQVSFSLEPDVSVYDIKLPIKKEEDRINIVRKSKLGFKKLHLELLEMFSTKDKKENPYGKRVKLKPSQRSKDKPHLETVIITNNSDKNTYGNAAAAPSSPVSPKSPGIHPMASRSLPPLPEQPKPPTEAKVNQSSVDLALRPPSQSNEGRIIYTQSDDGAEDVEEDTDRIYDEAEDEQHDYLEPLTLEDLKKISRPNQSSQDFYTYSVKEVIECFNLCFPDKPCLGTFCAEQRLDGSFFKRYEDPSMVFETLELSFIDKTKLKVRDLVTPVYAFILGKRPSRTCRIPSFFVRDLVTPAYAVILVTSAYAIMLVTSAYAIMLVTPAYAIMLVTSAYSIILAYAIILVTSAYAIILVTSAYAIIFVTSAYAIILAYVIILVTSGYAIILVTSAYAIILAYVIILVTSAYAIILVTSAYAIILGFKTKNNMCSVFFGGKLLAYSFHISYGVWSDLHNMSESRRYMGMMRVP